MYAIGYYYLHLRHSLTSLCVSQEANLEIVVKSLKTGLIRVGTISHVLWIVALQNTVSNATTAISGGSQRQGIRTWPFFAEFLVRCVFDCSYPLSSAAGGAFLGGFGLGAAQPGRRAAAPGGAQGGERPRPSDFCAVAGRERASGPTRRAN